MKTIFERSVLNQTGAAAAIFFVGLISPPDARAWFFFIPGGLIDAVVDAVSGSEGESCLPPNAKVGDKIRMPSGAVWSVKSLSGTSYRCSNPEYPIRALLVPLVETSPATSPLEAPQHGTTISSRAGLELPAGWKPSRPTEQERARGVILNAIEQSSGLRVTLYADKRDGVRDVLAYALAKKSQQSDLLKDVHASEVVALLVNGFPAWRYEVSGLAYNGTRYTYLQTVIDVGVELVLVSCWTDASEFQVQRGIMEKLAFGLTGFSPPRQLEAAADAASRNEAIQGAGLGSKSQAASVGTSSTPATPNSIGVAQRLRELQALYKEGLITQMEYEEKRKRILDGI